MMWDGGWGMGGGWVFGWIVGLVVVVLIVVGIILLVRGLSGRRDQGQATQMQAPSPEGTPRSALRILEERYARGDIDQEEFLRRKTDLTS